VITPVPEGDGARPFDRAGGEGEKEDRERDVLRRAVKYMHTAVHNGREGRRGGIVA